MEAERTTYRRYTELLWVNLSRFSKCLTLSCVLVLFWASNYRGTAKADCIATASPQFEAVGNVARRVYRLTVKTQKTVNSGSGFLVSGKRIIATNHHVVDGGMEFSTGYVRDDGRIQRVLLKVLAYFPQKDLALLEAEEDLPGEALSLQTRLPDYGTDLYAIGYPIGADLELAPGTPVANADFFRPTVLKGSVSRIMSDLNQPYRLQLQSPLSPGFSGGPLVDHQGFAIGVSTAVNHKLSTMSYGVPAGDLVGLLDACAVPLRGVDGECGERIGAPKKTEKLPPLAAGGNRPNAMDKELLKRAHEMLRHGYVAGARSIFEYLALNRGLPEHYEAWAMTFDKSVLDRLQVVGQVASEVRAQELYGVARRLRTEPSMPARYALARCSKSLCVLLEAKEGEAFVDCTRPQG